MLPTGADANATGVATGFADHHSHPPTAAPATASKPKASQTRDAGPVADAAGILPAEMLAALRAAVLWRQLGGSLWDFVFARRQMAAALDALLG